MINNDILIFYNQKSEDSPLSCDEKIFKIGRDLVHELTVRCLVYKTKENKV